MEDLIEIEGITIVKSFKYLGLDISCDKGAVLSAMKAKCKAHMTMVRGKI